jgi:hypothetical protein
MVSEFFLWRNPNDGWKEIRARALAETIAREITPSVEQDAQTWAGLSDFERATREAEEREDEIKRNRGPRPPRSIYAI